MTTALIPLPPSALPQAWDRFDAFLQSVHSVPTLDAVQERELALRVRKDGDVDAARQLTLANLRYVVWLARRYAGYGLALADLVQEGTAGLLKAIRRFDPDCGVRLISYAVHWVRAEIREYVLRNWQIVRRVTTKAQRKMFFKRRQLAALEAPGAAGREAELAQQLEVPLDDLREMRERLSASDVSMDAGSEHGASWEPVDHRDPLHLLEESESHRQALPGLRAAITALDARSRDILVNRCLVEPPLELAKLAARYGISIERVRQIQNKAMQTIRETLEPSALPNKPRPRSNLKQEIRAS